MREWVIAAALCACSSTTEGDDFEPIDGGTSTKPFDDATVSFEASLFDVSQESATFNGGGDFLCSGCVCDGTLRYCEQRSGGQSVILDSGLDGDLDDASDSAFGDASACDPDLDSGTSCFPIPLDCLPQPTCKCVLSHVSGPCGCSVDPSGNGLVVTCVYP
jgi:hypothetical protein